MTIYLKATIADVLRITNAKRISENVWIAKCPVMRHWHDDEYPQDLHFSIIKRGDMYEANCVYGCKVRDIIAALRYKLWCESV